MKTFSFLGAARAVSALAAMGMAMGGCGSAPAPPAGQQASAEAPTQQPPPSPAPPAQTFVSITPGELVKIYQDNDQYQANELASAYIDRMLKVDAVVQSVSNDPAGIVVVTSTGAEADPKDPTKLRLLFPKTAESSLSTLKAGAKIQAGCHIRQIDKAKIELADCSLI